MIAVAMDPVNLHIGFAAVFDFLTQFNGHCYPVEVQELLPFDE